MTGTVYVTHCIDTEGPLYESLEATFNRLSKTFGIDIRPTEENLKKLQNKEIDLDGDESEVEKFVSPKHIQTNETWDDILEQLDTITQSQFRNNYTDTEGNGWKFSWFIMDHVGFDGLNPRRRSLGHHIVYEQYRSHMEHNNITQDKIHWHYHPLSLRKDAHRGGTTYLNSSNIHKILSRKVVDKSWFPAAYRPGFHTERPDSHWFLEQWIPFDFGNQSGKSVDGQPDLTRGRFGMWNRAPTEWRPYNPAYDDYQSRGECNRYITRCLNMSTRHRNLTRNDIANAFREAKQGDDTILAFTDHDFRDMQQHIESVWNKITAVSETFENVDFEYRTAVEAMREVIGMDSLSKPGLTIDRLSYNDTPVIQVNAENKIFGKQPYLAIKTTSGEYYWQNFDFPKEDVWTFTFDFHTIPEHAVECVGIAANSPLGVTEVINWDPNTQTADTTYWNVSNQ